MVIELVNFLGTNTDQSIWLATKAGIFQGVKRTQTTNTVYLEGSFYFTGDVRLNIGNVTIKLDDIVAWGNSNPSFRNKFD